MNAAKYSMAKKVEVTISEENKSLNVSIKDDGIGFVSLEIETLGGNGIRNMKKRALQIGGKLEITSTENKGTNVELKIQL